MSTDQSNPAAWTTAITEIKPNRVSVRGYNIAELMGHVSFGGAVYLLLRGERPDEKVGTLIEAMLVASIDHGATPPSALAARTVASTGAALSASVAAGVMSINQHHGGAIENCAKALAQVVAKQKAGQSWDDAASSLLDEFKASGKRIAGFGHRIHTADPRTKRLFELATEAGVAAEHVEAARAVERVFEKKGKPLPINVDGAMGAVLADLGFEPEVMNGFFMIARVAGLIAHVREEQTRQKPMRKIDPIAHSYDGPASRSVQS